MRAGKQGARQKRERRKPVRGYEDAARADMIRCPRAEQERKARKSVVSGKSVSVRVDLGGRRINKIRASHTGQKTPEQKTMKDIVDKRRSPGMLEQKCNR